MMARVRGDLVGTDCAQRARQYDCHEEHRRRFNHEGHSAAKPQPKGRAVTRALCRGGSGADRIKGAFGKRPLLMLSSEGQSGVMNARLFKVSAQVNF